MSKITTSAWIICENNMTEDGKFILKKDTISFEDISEKEVLIEPIFGCWEGNMMHALEGKPVNVCRKRRESKVVLGNSGVVRAIKTGSKVTGVKKGDMCVFLPYGPSNRFGYLDKAFGFGYDEPGSIGMLAKQTKVFENQLAPVPKSSKISLRQWPMISVRFSSGWSNWEVAFKCLEAQVSREEYPSPYVFGWGGGVALSELLLAKEQGFTVAMTASCDKRLEFIKKLGIIPIDRRQFADLSYDPEKYDSDREYRKRYFAALKNFRSIVNEITGGEGVSIFIENIGLPVYPATMRVLSRPGVIATS
jgi:NADPH:quinone reductase-like Zn-dependent oxidoreductase